MYHLYYGDFVGVVTPSCLSMNVCIYYHIEHNLQNTVHSVVIYCMFRSFFDHRQVDYVRSNSKYSTVQYSTGTVPFPCALAAVLVGTGIVH